MRYPILKRSNSIARRATVLRDVNIAPKSAGARFPFRRLFLILFGLTTLVLNVNSGMAQCNDPDLCGVDSTEYRVRTIVIDGCILRVYYNVFMCDGVCSLTIDSVDYPQLATSCSGCVNDLNTVLFDAIRLQLVLHGSYFTTCWVQPNIQIVTRYPSCWRTSTSGGGGGGSTIYLRPCSELPCCVVIEDVITDASGKIVATEEVGRSVNPDIPYECEAFGGAGCTDICR